MGILSRVANGNAPRPLQRKAALELGFDDEWANEVVENHSADLARWAGLGEVPAEEDPRQG